jgi:ketosteroid isomerase-like protein
MRQTIALLATLAALATTPVLADDRALLTQHMQDMADALVPGDVTPWNEYLDPDVIYADENGDFTNKAGMIKQVQPMPKGLGGEIKVELLSYREGGDTAVALFRQHETERYYGQTIHASYLTSTTWKKHKDGWQMIAAGTLAERTDPPAITLPASALQKFTGTYKLKDSEPTYTLAVTDGKLMGGRVGRKTSEWKAETRDVFFIPGDNRIRKIFQYGASGKVTGFIERRESWDLVWEKVG